MEHLSNNNVNRTGYSLQVGPNYLKIKYKKNYGGVLLNQLTILVISLNDVAYLDVSPLLVVSNVTPLAIQDFDCQVRIMYETFTPPTLCVVSFSCHNPNPVLW